MAYYSTLTQIIPLTTIRRERLLPVEGTVLVRVGARVEPQSIVARADVPGRYRILNVAQELKVSPDATEKYIRVRPGRTVEPGQVVASRRTALGLFPRVVRAPQEGVVAAVGGGRVLLETGAETVEVRAHLPGTVSGVIPKLGVVVEAMGALIQGVWGSGGEAFGVLKVVVDQPDQPLRSKSIDVTCHGAVLVGGSTMDKDALQQAMELQVRGVIIGSWDPEMLKIANQMPFPIVATEGLGQAAMAAPIFHLLRTNDGREAAVSGRIRPRWDAVRPEVVIPLPTKSAPSPPLPGTPLEAGVQVRVVRGPAKGAVGTVRYLPAQPQLIETGAKVQGAIVAFEGGGELFVPILNLDRLG